MWWLLVRVAMAAPFTFTTSPGAEVEVLPQVEAGRTEVVVRNNRENLRLQLGYDRREGLRAWTASDLGTGWVVNIWTESPTNRVELKREGERWTAYVVPSSARVDGTLQGPELPLAELAVRPSGQDDCEAATTTPLVPLRGRDMLHAFLPSDFDPDLPRWTEAEPARDFTWTDVHALQARVGTLRNGAERATTMYRLGAMHRDRGHAREASYYFGLATDAGAPAGLARIQRAGALLQSRQWVAARAEALKAAETGVVDIAALEVVGVAALMADDVGTAGIGRAIARRTSQPEASLVAGALLLRAQCSAEALTPLARTRLLTGTRDAMGRLLLADAQVLSGLRREAAITLARVSDRELPERWRGMLRARSRLVAMVALTPDQWPTFVPGLDRDAQLPDEEGVENAFLLGQVGEALGDARMAHDAYSAVLDRSRHFATGEPGRRLLTIWARRLGELLAAGRSMDAVSFHAGTWRSSLLPLVQEPGLLRSVAEQAMTLGLYEPALVTLRDVATLEGQRGEDDRHTILALADAYRASGRFEAALEALDFYAKRPADPILDARATFLRTRTRDDMGDTLAARAGYEALARPGVPISIADEARLRLAMMRVEEGRCEQALPALADVAFYPSDISPGLVGLARSRCLFTIGDAATARTTAMASIPWLTAPQVALWADYLARVGADTSAAGSALPAPEAAPAAATSARDLVSDAASSPSPASTGALPSERKDIWARLLAEEKADSALRARIPKTAARK